MEVDIDDPDSDIVTFTCVEEPFYRANRGWEHSFLTGRRGDYLKISPIYWNKEKKKTMNQMTLPLSETNYIDNTPPEQMGRKVP